MKFRNNFPSSLQYGDNLEIKGRAGQERFILELLSDHLAFDPFVSTDYDDIDNALPLVETQPLQIIFETTGSWDVNAKSPETSTTSHGTSARRCGFRAGEPFTCRIAIRKEFFVISLNNIQIASSEHLVPIASIHAIEIDGDSLINSVKYGHPVAIDHHKDNFSKDQVAESITECRLSDMLLFEDNYVALDEAEPIRKNELGNSEAILSQSLWEKPTNKLMNNVLRGELVRTNSYQLVFDSDNSELDEDSGKADGKCKRRASDVVYSASQANLLVIDDPEFSLDEENQKMLETICPKKRVVKRRNKKSLKRCSLLSKKPGNKHQQSNGFEQPNTVNNCQTNVCHDKMEIEPKWNEHSTMITSAQHSGQAQEKGDYRQNCLPYPVKMQRSISENTRFPTTISDNRIARRNSWNNLQFEEFWMMPTFDSPAHDWATKRRLRRSQTIATSNRNNLGLRHPLSSSDKLWDELLPPLELKCDMLAGRTIKNKQDLKTLSRILDQKQVSSEQQSEKSLGSKQLDALNFSADRNTNKISSVRVNLTKENNRTVCEASDLGINSKLHSSKTSQPMLLIDFRPIDDEEFVVEENAKFMGISNQTNPWAEKPKLSSNMGTSSEASSQSSVGRYHNNIGDKFEEKGRGFGGKAFDTRRPEGISNVAGSVLPVASAETVVNIKPPEYSTAQKIELNTGPKQKTYRSRLPRPKSELIATQTPAKNDDPVVSKSKQNIVSDHSKEDYSPNEHISINKTQKQPNESSTSVSKQPTKPKVHSPPRSLKNSTKPGRSSSNRNLTPTGMQQTNTRHLDADALNIPKANTNGSLAKSGTKNSSSMLLEPKIQQMNGSSESVSSQTSKLKKFVQSPRRWISEKFSSNRKQKTVAK